MTSVSLLISLLFWIAVFSQIPASNGFSNHIRSRRVAVPLGSQQIPSTLSHSTALFQKAVAASDAPALSADKRTTSDQVFIRDALQKNALFTSLPEESLIALIDAFEKYNATNRKQVIVQQGDSCEDGGGYVYIIAEGECTVEVDGNVVPRPFGKMGSGQIFGELSVLYSGTRSATILTESESVILFRILGDTFKDILDPCRNVDYDLETMQEIDGVINELWDCNIYGGRGAGDIIPQYKPERIWLWSQWCGTIAKLSLRATVGNMLFCVGFIVLVQESHGGGADFHHPTQYFWTADGIVLPDKDLPFVQDLFLIRKIWGYQQTLTTFILTFFVNQAFGFWRGVYCECRNIQSNLDGYFLILSTNVKRNDDGSFTEESAKLLEDVGQYSRLWHALFWASIAKRFQVLQTDLGLERMASRGLLTQTQLEILQELELSTKDQLKLAPLQWMLVRSIRAMDDGVVAGDTATKGMLLKGMNKLRGSYTKIPNKLAGRMPLAYTQFVQILVDAFVLVSPIALYAELGAYSVIAVGIITLFYTGLLNLAKIFLDPLNNENYCEEDANFMDLGVLIRESNDASTQWKRAGERLPF